MTSPEGSGNGEGHSGEKVEQDKHTSKIPDQPTSDSHFPWDFTHKWPLTHSERIIELQSMAPFYENTPQKDNIAAAIAWHATFPPDEICSSKLVSFQKGKKVEESQVRLEDGMPWVEGCVIDLMAGHGSTQPVAAPTGPSNVTGSTNYTYYNRTSNSHTYELKIEARAPVSASGNGQVFTMSVHYDSGCGSMAVPLTDLNAMFAPTPVTSLPTIPTITANGPALARYVALEGSVQQLSKPCSTYLSEFAGG